MASRNPPIADEGTLPSPSHKQSLLAPTSLTGQPGVAARRFRNANLVWQYETLDGSHGPTAVLDNPQVLYAARFLAEREALLLEAHDALEEAADSLRGSSDKVAQDACDRARKAIYAIRSRPAATDLVRERDQ